MGTMGATSQQMLEVTRIAAEGAATGGSDLVDVTNALTAVVASGIPGVQNYSQAMGVLNATVGVGDMTMQDLANSMGSGMVATVKGFGLTIKDVGAALAVFGDNNIRGAVAGTDLRMSVQALAAPAKAAQEWFDKFGWKQGRLADDMRKGGLKLALEDLQSAFKRTGVSADEQGEVITEMFGKKAGAGLNVLLDQMDRVESKYPALQAGADGAGAAWDKASKTLNQQFRDIRSGFDAMMVRLGEKLSPELSKFITLIESKGSPVVHNFMTALSGITGGFTGHTSAPNGGGQVKTTAGGEQHGTAGQQAAPLTGWQEIGKTFRGIADDLSRFGEDVAKAFRSIRTAAVPTLELLGGAGLTALKTIAGILSGVVGPALVTVAGFMDRHKTAVRDLIAVALIPLAIRLTALAVLKPIGVIAGLAKDIATFPFSQGKQIWEGLKTGYDSVVSGAGKVKDAYETAALRGMYMWDSVKNGASSVKDTVSGAFEFTKFQAQSMWTTTKSGASSALSFVSDKASTAKGALVGAYNSAKFTAGYMWQGLKDGTTQAASWLGNVGKSAVDMGGKVVQAAKAGAATAWTGLVSGLKSVAMFGKAAATALWETAVAAGQSALAATRAAAAWIAEKIATMASAVAEGVLTAAEWLLNFALDANPIGLVIIAIVALVAAIIYAWNHCAWFREAVEATFHAIAAVAMWLWHNIFEPAFQGIASAAVWLWHAISSAFDWIVHAGEGAANWLMALPGKIGSWFADAGSWLLNAGKHLIEGLWNGISSMGSWISSKIGSFVKSVVPGPVLKVLGISSPSKVFAEIGGHVVEGLAVGIEGKAARATGASSRMATAVAAAGVAGLAVGAPAGGAGALAVPGSTPSASPTVVINVTVNGSLLTNRDLRNVLEEQMYQLGMRGSTTWQNYQRR
jgi:TP901 family phage tail tape measure protein